MSCCGDKRHQVQASHTLRSDSEPPATPAVPPVSGVLFESVERTGLTATGPLTCQHYRFEGPGARVEVDDRDAPSLTAVPNLRRV